jgi:hypothetical protein
MEKTRLNLACGNDYREGYINIDNQSMFPESKVDINADITTITYPKNSVDEILLSHIVMYFRPEELLPLLIKWREWLKKGGLLRIETINLNEVISHRSVEKLLIPLFGKPNTTPHRWAWSFSSLYLLLEKAGFEEVEPEGAAKNPIRDFGIFAIK